MTVRSYRHARRSAARSNLLGSWITLTLPQMIFAGLGAVVGLLLGLAILPGMGPLITLVVGLGSGLYVGSMRSHGRDPFQVVRARTQGHRPATWSPRWGTLRPSTRQLRWRATVTETVEVPAVKRRPMLELTRGSDESS